MSVSPPNAVGLDDAECAALCALSRSVHLREASVGAVVQAVLRMATEVVPRASDVALDLRIKGRVIPHARSGGDITRLALLQDRTGVGPHVDAVRDKVTITATDDELASRWPQFAAAAAEFDIRALVCLPLWVNGVTLGSLSLYADRPFDAADRRLAELVATHASIALDEALQRDQLRRATVSRDIIGQAKGILMERHRLSADQAFTMLRRSSQKHNRKLVDIAETLTRTGTLPGQTPKTAG